jgi:hypothetical protein
MEESPGEANGPQLVNKFPACYGTRRFIALLTTVRHLSLSYTRQVQSTLSHSLPLGTILILSSHLHLGPVSGLFPPGLPINRVTISVLSIHATLFTHLTLLYLITLITGPSQERCKRVLAPTWNLRNIKDKEPAKKCVPPYRIHVSPLLNCCRWKQRIFKKVCIWKMFCTMLQRTLCN